MGGRKGAAYVSARGRLARSGRVGQGVVESCCTGPLQATAGREVAIAPSLKLRKNSSVCSLAANSARRHGDAERGPGCQGRVRMHAAPAAVLLKRWSPAALFQGP